MSKTKKDLRSGREYVTAPFEHTIVNKSTNWSQRVIINQKIAPINPIQCGKQICPPRYSYTSDERDIWLLHFVTSGKGTLTKNGKTQSVATNDLFVIRPFEKASYTADTENPWHYIWIGFYTDHTVPMMLESCDVINAPFLNDAFNRAFDADGFEQGDTFGAYEHYLCGCIWEIFGLLLNNSRKDSKTSLDYIKPAQTIMELYFSDPKLTVAEIASRLRISKEHFSRIFKSKVGISPKKYLNDIRMKKSVEFLTQSKDTITQIAQKIGFADVFAFSRAFSHYYGCPPSEYVTRHKENKEKL